MAIGRVDYKKSTNLEPVASAITSMGQSASKKDKPEALGEKIKKISTDATAVEAKVLQGETFYAAGQKKTGTMPSRGAWTNRLGINSKIVIPVGYHNGQGYIDQAIPTKGAQTYTPKTTNQVIGAGQYLSGAQTILGDPNLIPDNIRKGKTIFGVKGNFVSNTSTYWILNGENFQNEFGFSATSLAPAIQFNHYGDGYFYLNGSDSGPFNRNYISILNKPFESQDHPTLKFEIRVVEKTYFRFALVKPDDVGKITDNHMTTGVYCPYFPVVFDFTSYMSDFATYTIDLTKLEDTYYIIMSWRSASSISGTNTRLRKIYLGI